MFEATLWKQKYEESQQRLQLAESFHDVAVRQRDVERWKNDRLAAALQAVTPTMDESSLDGIEVAARRYNGAGIDTVLALVAEVRRLTRAVEKLKDIESLKDC